MLSYFDPYLNYYNELREKTFKINMQPLAISQENLLHYGWWQESNTAVMFVDLSILVALNFVGTLNDFIHLPIVRWPKSWNKKRYVFKFHINIMSQRIQYRGVHIVGKFTWHDWVLVFSNDVLINDIFLLPGKRFGK